MDSNSTHKKKKFSRIALSFAFILVAFLSYFGIENTLNRTAIVSPTTIPVVLPYNGNINSKKVISVSLLPNSTFYIGSNIVAKNKLEDELHSRLSVKKDKSIMINADRNSSTADLVYILDIAKQNRWKIAINTKPN